MGDMVKHDGPHTHSPTHPAAPSPIPCTQHPCTPHKIIKGAATVMTNSMAQARSTDMTDPCMDGMTCPIPVPGGPGLITKASLTVLVEGLPAARKDDIVTFASCILLTGTGMIAKITQGSNDVEIGG